jgi:hypothetical protein
MELTFAKLVNWRAIADVLPISGAQEYSAQCCDNGALSPVARDISLNSVGVVNLKGTT